MPGLSDVVIMVRGRSRAFLAGPPLLMAATGEIATEENWVAPRAHRGLGSGEHLAEMIAKHLGWQNRFWPTADGHHQLSIQERSLRRRVGRPTICWA